MKNTVLVIILAVSTGLLVTGLGDLPLAFAQNGIDQGADSNILKFIKNTTDAGGHLGLITGALVATTGILALIAASILGPILIRRIESPGYPA